jgi:hypothetical protein
LCPGETIPPGQIQEVCFTQRPTHLRPDWRGRVFSPGPELTAISYKAMTGTTGLTELLSDQYAFIFYHVGVDAADQTGHPMHE